MICLRPTEPTDLDFVMATEAANERFVGQWSRDRHRAALAEPEKTHLIVESVPGGERVGYLILARPASPARCVALVRIAIARPGHGFGRAALAAVQRLVFEGWRAHRLWLDVYDFNVRAKRLYEAAGFSEEGVLRECLWIEGRYESLVVMGILEYEHAALRTRERAAGENDPPGGSHEPDRHRQPQLPSRALGGAG